MLRKRRVEKVIEAIQETKNLDVFPKLEDDYKEMSSTRGTVSIIVFLVIIFLAIGELNFFFKTQLKYSFEVDFDYNSKLKLNIDITVAMPCNSIGADVMDSTSRDILTDKSVNMEDTWFEMSPRQKLFHKQISNVYIDIREKYHALHSILWLSNSEIFSSKLPPREEYPDRPKDACRIHGTFELNKVAGIFHIITGKSVSFFGNHAHMINMFSNTPANFSHRIDHLSFGENSNLVHNALNFELKLTENQNQCFQYFVAVVSTEIGTAANQNLYQYAVTEKKRLIDHNGGSHGTPGIFFNYDISPLKVKVDKVKKSWLELIIPLIGIVGGIFSTSIMINALYQSFRDFFAPIKN